MFSCWSKSFGSLALQCLCICIWFEPVLVRSIQENCTNSNYLTRFPPLYVFSLMDSKIEAISFAKLSVSWRFKSSVFPILNIMRKLINESRRLDLSIDRFHIFGSFLNNMPLFYYEAVCFGDILRTKVGQSKYALKRFKSSSCKYESSTGISGSNRLNRFRNSFFISALGV